MATKIPQTKNEAFAQLDAMLSEKEKNELKRKGLQTMGTLKEYKCKGCGYTLTGTRKGRTLGMMGEIETEKVPRKCPKCGGDMKETGTVIMIDQWTHWE